MELRRGELPDGGGIVTGRVSGNIRSYQLRYTQRARAVTPEVNRAVAEVGTAAMTTARELSSGPLSLKELRGMGHPYARRRPFGPGITSPWLINAQSGTFRASWRLVMRTNAKSVSVTVKNTDPKAKKWLTGAGTKKMVGRPILGEIAKRIHPRLETETRKVLGRVIRAGGGQVAGGGLGWGASGGSGLRTGGVGGGGVSVNSIVNAFRRGYAATRPYTG